jgi:acyl-CoA thioester hydrolase
MTTMMELTDPCGQADAASHAPVTFRGVVYAWHLDHMGHMNVQHYVGMFDNASWVLLGMLGADASHFREHRTGVAALEQKISYLREMRAGDLVEIRSGILEVGEKILRIVHEMRNTGTGIVAARTTILGVYFDTGTRRSMLLPREIRERAHAVMIADPEASRDAL